MFESNVCIIFKYIHSKIRSFYSHNCCVFSYFLYFQTNVKNIRYGHLFRSIVKKLNIWTIISCSIIDETYLSIKYNYRIKKISIINGCLRWFKEIRFFYIQQQPKSKVGGLETFYVFERKRHTADISISKSNLHCYTSMVNVWDRLYCLLFCS